MILRAPTVPALALLALLPTGGRAADEPKPVESAVLKAELVEVALEVMRATKPDIDRAEVKTRVETAIKTIRRHDPAFLVVSPKVEQRLKAGLRTEGAAGRIKAAKTFLAEFELPLTGLVRTLLPQHEAGKLNAVRTELLAQLIVADAKKAKAALSDP